MQMLTKRYNSLPAFSLLVFPYSILCTPPVTAIVPWSNLMGFEIAPDGVFHRSALVGNGLDVWLVKQFGGGFVSQPNGPDE